MMQQISHYTIIKHLGSGGFSDTFLVKDTYLPSEKVCVLKQLKPITHSPQVYQLVKERFQREAVVLEELGNSHPQIPTLYAYFEDNGQFYLVQEYIEGQTLASLVEASGPQTETTVKTLLLQILDILEFIQSKAIIHRDIKPENIILRQGDQQPVLIDFGAVRETMGTQGGSGQGATSSIVIGTPGFMPSEQAAGRPVFASDLYALGLTAIYLLTGKYPQDLGIHPLTGDIQWRSLVTVSPDLARVLDQGIAITPRERFADAQGMKAALLGQSFPPARSPGLTPTIASAPLRPRSRRWPWVMGGMGLTLSLGATAFYVYQQHQLQKTMAQLETEKRVQQERDRQQQEWLEQRRKQQQEIAEKQRQLEAQQEAINQEKSIPPMVPSDPVTDKPQSPQGQPDRGMWVISVKADSEAAQAGIRGGQILVSLNGVFIDRVETANRIVGQNTGASVMALVWDGGTYKKLVVVPHDAYIGVNLCQLSLCPDGQEP